VGDRADAVFHEYKRQWSRMDFMNNPVELYTTVKKTSHVIPF